MTTTRMAAVIVDPSGAPVVGLRVRAQLKPLADSGWLPDHATDVAGAVEVLTDSAGLVVVPLIPQGALEATDTYYQITAADTYTDIAISWAFVVPSPPDGDGLVEIRDHLVDPDTLSPAAAPLPSFYLQRTELGALQGVASLDSDGKLSADQIPDGLGGDGGAPSGPAGGALAGSYPDPTLSTATIEGFDAAGTAAAAVDAHVSASDPHGDRAAAVSALTGHVSADDPHGDRAYAVAQVAAQIAALVGAAPSALDTIYEIAAAIGSDETALATLMTLVGQKLDQSANLADLGSADAARTNLGLSEVASSGSYIDLSDKPIEVADDLGSVPDDIPEGTVIVVPGVALAAVATSGSASDITTGTLPDSVIPAGIARDSEVAAAVAALVASAPSTLDTLAEISAALGADPNFATTITALIALKADDSAVMHLAGTETVAGAKTFSSSPAVPTPTSSLAATPKSYVDAVGTRAVAAGSWFFPVQPGASTPVGPSQGSARVTPIVLATPQPLDTLGFEVTTAGEAGSKFHILVYSDNGNGFPGALLYDSGALAADAVGNVTVTATGLILPRGVLWIGGVSQLCPTTPPTLRCLTTACAPPIPIPLSAIPAAGVGLTGIAAAGFSTSIPGTFPTTWTVSTGIPRLFARAA